jgi:hypothetical protein
MSKSTGDWLEIREAIELADPLIHPTEWTGSERYAPTAGEAAAEVRKVFDLTPDQLAREHAAWSARVDAQAKQERAERKAAGAEPSGIKEGLEKLRAELAGETDERRRRVLTKVIENLSAAPSKPDRNPRRIARRRAEFITDVLADWTEASYEAGLPARMRWVETHALIRDEVLAGRVRARARLPGGDLAYLSTEKRREIFPSPGDTDARTKIDGIPATIIIARADLERVFAPTQPAEPATAAEPQGQKRRSHQPTRERVRDAMQSDIDAGTETLETLDKMTQQYRADHYGVNRETAMLALAALVARQKATSSG